MEFSFNVDFESEEVIVSIDQHIVSEIYRDEFRELHVKKIKSTYAESADHFIAICKLLFLISDEN
jgi:hypothetical protein